MSLREKIAHNLLGLLWVLVLMAGWFLALNLVRLDPSLRDVTMVGAGIFLAMMKDIGQNIWRKKPPGISPTP